MFSDENRELLINQDWDGFDAFWHDQFHDPQTR